jgi:hypothetical protein
MRNTMNPFWFAMKIGGIALVGAAGTAILVKKLCPKPSDLMAGAIHFKKGMEEFQRGFTSVFLGASGSSDPETEKKRKESARIHID